MVVNSAKAICSVTFEYSNQRRPFNGHRLSDSNGVTP